MTAEELRRAAELLRERSDDYRPHAGTRPSKIAATLKMYDEILALATKLEALAARAPESQG